MKIAFRRGNDFFALQGQLELPEAFDPSTSDFTVELSNADGNIYSGSLLAQDLQRNGRRYTFKDKTAKLGPGTRDGLSKVQFFWSRDDLWRFRVNAFSDLSAADDPVMTMSVLIDGQYFESTATFEERKKGYRLKRLPLPLP